MGIRTGSEFRESLRDGRTIYVDGQRVSDVTSYPPFQGTIETLARSMICSMSIATSSLILRRVTGVARSHRNARATTSFAAEKRRTRESKVASRDP